LVTGPIELFNRKLFFSSFVAVTDPTDPCKYGVGRLFAVDYQLRDTGQPNTGTIPETYYPAEVPAADLGSDSNWFNIHPADVNGLTSSIPAEMQDKVLMGVNIIKRPQCITSAGDTVETDIYGRLGGIVNPATVGAAAYELHVAISGGGTATTQAGSQIGAKRITGVSGPGQSVTVNAFTGSCD
jgi:hypothetical protein